MCPWAFIYVLEIWDDPPPSRVPNVTPYLRRFQKFSSVIHFPVVNKNHILWGFNPVSTKPLIVYLETNSQFSVLYSTSNGSRSCVDSMLNIPSHKHWKINLNTRIFFCIPFHVITSLHTSCSTVFFHKQQWWVLFFATFLDKKICGLFRFSVTINLHIFN